MKEDLELHSVRLALAHACRKIFIVDALFNNPLRHAKRVLEALRDARTRAPWTGFFTPSQVDEELLALVKETHGGAPLKLTIESGSNAMLRSLAKGFVADDVRAATRLCRRMKVPFSFTVLFGAEGETEATVAETLDLVAGEKPEYLSASIGVYVYPSTPLALRTRGRLWSTDEELLGQTLIPVERESIERQIEARLAGCGFPVYVH